jgi:hypothetical protein
MVAMIDNTAEAAQGVIALAMVLVGVFIAFRMLYKFQRAHYAKRLGKTVAELTPEERQQFDYDWFSATDVDDNGISVLPHEPF